MRVCVFVCNMLCGVYLVVVPEPFSVSQSGRGGVTGNLQNTRLNRHMTFGSLVPLCYRYDAAYEILG